jgi:hypothetical protein
LEGVEASHNVDGVVRPGQVLHLTSAELALWRALTRDRERRLGCVQAGDVRAALGRELRRQPRPAAHVEQLRPRLNARGIENSLVEGQGESFQDFR